MLKLRVVTISTAMRRFSIPQHCIAAQWSDLVWGILYFILYTEVYWGILYFILYTILYSILYSLRYIIYYTLYCLSVRASLRSKSTSWDSAGGQNANICKLARPIFVYRNNWFHEYSQTDFNVKKQDHGFLKRVCRWILTSLSQTSAILSRKYLQYFHKLGFVWPILKLWQCWQSFCQRASKVLKILKLSMLKLGLRQLLAIRQHCRLTIWK